MKQTLAPKVRVTVKQHALANIASAKEFAAKSSAMQSDTITKLYIWGMGVDSSVLKASTLTREEIEHAVAIGVECRVALAKARGVRSLPGIASSPAKRLQQVKVHLAGKFS